MNKFNIVERTICDRAARRQLIDDTCQDMDEKRRKKREKT